MSDTVNFEQVAIYPSHSTIHNFVHTILFTVSQILLTLLTGPIALKKQEN